MFLRNLLTHPLAKGSNIDDPCAVELRKSIIQSKPFLRRIYEGWYANIAADIPGDNGVILEIGSGAGFLKDFIPVVITSDIYSYSNIDILLNAHALPFSDDALSGIVMIDVLHHLPKPRMFFKEARRCVTPGGIIKMIEPWVTPWSYFVYSRFHHEPFRPKARKWEFPSSGPLSGANGALPWIVFYRDKDRFEQEFPEFHIKEIKLHTPFSYLISGGVSLRCLMPVKFIGIWLKIEERLNPWISLLAMFSTITLVRRSRN